MLFREGSRPSGCPRPMRRGWLRRNRLPEPSGTSSCRRVLCLSIRLGVFPISSVESQSGGLGHKNATIARRALQILRLLLGWDTGTAYTGKYPIPLDGNSPLSDCRFADFGRQQAAKLDGKQHEILKGKDCDPLHLFKQAASVRGKQVIISTQSAPLLNEFAPEDVIVVERTNGESTFRRLDSSELSEWLEEYALGELWQKMFLEKDHR